MARLSWPGWLVIYWDRFSCSRSWTPDTVIHPSANWARHRVTSLIETNAVVKMTAAGYVNHAVNGDTDQFSGKFWARPDGWVACRSSCQSAELQRSVEVRRSQTYRHDSQWIAVLCPAFSAYNHHIQPITFHAVIVSPVSTLPCGL